MVNARVRLDPGSRKWSGGGSAMWANLEMLARKDAGMFSAGTDAGGRHDYVLVPRNAVPARRLVEGRYVVIPQNAWPWSQRRGSAREQVRWAALRGASEVSIARACGVIRISSAIPTRGRPASAVVPNVLDEGFEIALRRRPISLLDVRRAVVSVGSMSTYRNLDGLLRGYSLYREAGGGLQLVIAGSSGVPSVRRMLGAAAQGNSSLAVIPFGLQRSMVLSLFSDARLVVFPSRVEASPFALLEALAVDANVVASDIPGHRETAAGAPVQWFNPGDAGSLASALSQAETRGPFHSPWEQADYREAQREAWRAKLATEVQGLIAR